MTTYYNTWDDCSENFRMAFEPHCEVSITDDGHICYGYGKLIASLPFHLGCSLG